MKFRFVRVIPKYFNSSLEGFITYLYILILCCILISRHDHVLSFHLAFTSGPVFLIATAKAYVLHFQYECFRPNAKKLKHCITTYIRTME